MFRFFHIKKNLMDFCLKLKLESKQQIVAFGLNVSHLEKVTDLLTFLSLNFFSLKWMLMYFDKIYISFLVII